MQQPCKLWNKCLGPICPHCPVLIPDTCWLGWAWQAGSMRPSRPPLDSYTNPTASQFLSSQWEDSLRLRNCLTPLLPTTLLCSAHAPEGRNIVLMLLIIKWSYPARVHSHLTVPPDFFWWRCDGFLPWKRFREQRKDDIWKQALTSQNNSGTHKHQEIAIYNGVGGCAPAE